MGKIELIKMHSFFPNNEIDFLCVFITVLVALYLYYRTVSSDNPQYHFSYPFFVAIILAFSLFFRPEAGDFWHTLERYTFGDPSIYTRHWEGAYYWLKDLIPNNYLLWRCCIWGPAAIIIAIAMKRMNLPSGLAVLVFILYALRAYYYTRNCLGLSLLLLAVTILTTDSQDSLPIKRLLIFLLLIGISWFFHKSMPMYIGIAVVSLMIPASKKGICLALVGAVVVAFFANYIAESVLNMQIWIGGESESGIGYLELERQTHLNWKGIISKLIYYLPFAYIAFYGFKDVVGKESGDVAYKTFYLITMIIWMVSFVFNQVHGRLFKSGMYSFAFFTTMFLTKNWRSVRSKRFLTITCIYYLWELFIFIVT